MAVQSFAEAHAQIFGGQQNQPQLANPSGTGLTLFEQAHQALIQNQQAKSSPQPIQSPKVVTATPQQQKPSLLNQVANSFVSGIQHMPLPTELLDKTLFPNTNQNQGLQSPVPTKQLLPQAQKTIQTQNVLKGIRDFAGGYINAIPQGVKSASDLGTNLGQGTATPQNVVGDMADIVMAASMFLGAGEAAPLVQGVKQAAEQGVKQAAVATGKAIAKESVIGGGFGLLSGLSSGRDITNPKDYITNLWNNVKTGVAIGAGAGIVTHVVLPLGKTATTKAGAVFVSNINKSPKVDKITMAPEVAQATVLHDPQMEKSSGGKAILKSSIEAQQTDNHVAVTPTKDGAYSLPNGEKVDVSVTTPYDPSMATPKTELPFTPSTHITGEDKQIEADFHKQLSSDYTGAVEKYNALPDSEGGKILNVDTARELSSVYQQDRTSKSAAVHEPASAFINKLYEDKLKEPVTDGKDTVVFTAGGTGAGKSTAIQTIPEVKQVKDNAQFVYDTTASSAQSMIGKVQKAIDSGKNVFIAYILRDPVDALENGSLPRAMRTGRAVPLEAHLSSHVKSLEAILKIADHFKNNEHFHVEVIDNNYGKENARLVPLDNLRSLSYNTDELRKQLHESLNKQYETNKISDEVYNATKGESNPITIQGKSASNGTSNSEESQRESSSRSENTANSGTKSESESRGNSQTANSEQRGNTKNDQLGTRKVLNTKETQYLQDIIKGQFDHLATVAKNPDEFVAGAEKIYKDISQKAGNDKVVLSALRTRINKEMYDIAGASGGNYKENYATLQTIIKEDPEMGKIVTRLETMRNELDDKLLTAQKPEKGTAPTPIRPNKNEENHPTGTVEPVKNSSDQKVSSAQKHLLERLATEDPERYNAILDKNGELKYNVNHAKDDLEHAAKLVESDPQKAYETAMGYHGFPEKGTMNALAIMLSDRAAKEKNYSMMADLERAISLRSTREGQEIAALRGRNTENAPHTFMQQVLSTRLARLGKGTITSGIKTDVKTMLKEMGSVKERAVAKIDKATLQLQKELRKKQAMIKSAQSILDDLTCK